MHTASLADNDKNPTHSLITYFSIIIALAHIYFNVWGTLSELWFSALHFGSFTLLAAYHYSCIKNPTPLSRFFDLSLGFVAFFSAVYLITMEEALYDRGQHFIFTDWFFAIASIVIVIEFTRRTSSWVIPLLIIIALSYVAGWGRYVEGMFHFPGLSWETVLFRSYFSSDGMFGTIARISSTYVFMFILLGAFLVQSGAGDFIIRLARSLVGRFIGGAGLVAVFGSALMGSISGSAVANTVSTGMITIPLMKRSGFSPRFAAGVESAASTGGQIMPPVMGAGAFVMSSYTQIPYLHIIAVAVFPALLYFITVALFVRIEARKLHLVVMDTETEPVMQVLKEGGHLLIPLFILVGLLIVGFTPTYTAGLSIISVIVISWFTKDKMGFKKIIQALVAGVNNMITMAVLLVAVGIIINVVSTTGIGNTFSLMINNWAEGSLLLSIIFIAIASLILGMGLPVTAAYIVLGTLSAPALYELITQSHLLHTLTTEPLSDTVKAVASLINPELAQQQILTLSQAQTLLTQLPQEMLTVVRDSMLSPELMTTTLLSAHMIIYWLSQDSNVTPPVCLAAFTAASIAGSPPMRTGLTAWKLAKGLYILPLLFAYTPLLSADIKQSFMIFIFALPAVYALVGAIEGYLEGKVPWHGRIILLAIAAILFIPSSLLILKLLGLILLGVIFIVTREKASI